MKCMLLSFTSLPLLDLWFQTCLQGKASCLDLACGMHLLTNQLVVFDAAMNLS